MDLMTESVDVESMSLTVEMVNVFMDLVSVIESINAGMELMNLDGKCLVFAQYLVCSAGVTQSFTNASQACLFVCSFLLCCCFLLLFLLLLFAPYLTGLSSMMLI